MSLDYSKGYCRDEWQVARDARHDKIVNWLGKKSIHTWKRALYMLYQCGDDLHTEEVARWLNVNMSTVYRTLKKQELYSKVKGKIRKNKMIWHLTNYGIDSVYKMYENGYLPSFLFERT